MKAFAAKNNPQIFKNFAMLSQHINQNCYVFINHVFSYNATIMIEYSVFVFNNYAKLFRNRTDVFLDPNVTICTLKLKIYRHFTLKKILN